jgi:hypothetical protein
VKEQDSGQARVSDDGEKSRREDLRRCGDSNWAPCSFPGPAVVNSLTPERSRLKLPG